MVNELVKEAGMRYNNGKNTVTYFGALLFKLQILEEKMAEFTIQEMKEMQRELQEQYKHKWEPIGPETGKNKLLWMIGEIGEVIDIVKKNGGTKACTDEKLRKDLIEEMADVLMYYNDVLLCYGISEAELKQAYVEKFERNMKRW